MGILEKNKISSVGACSIADALIVNKGLLTLNLMQQTTANFGEETLERYITMFNDNITLTKIQWRLTSRKSFMLNKLQTSNVEIKKRKDKGEDYNAYLPDHMKVTGDAGTAGADGGYAALAASANAPSERRRSSVQEVQEHLDKLEEAVGKLDIGDAKEDEES